MKRSVGYELLTAGDDCPSSTLILDHGQQIDLLKTLALANTPYHLKSPTLYEGYPGKGGQGPQTLSIEFKGGRSHIRDDDMLSSENFLYFFDRLLFSVITLKADFSGSATCRGLPSTKPSRMALSNCSKFKRSSSSWYIEGYE